METSEPLAALDHQATNTTCKTSGDNDERRRISFSLAMKNLNAGSSTDYDCCGDDDHDDDDGDHQRLEQHRPDGDAAAGYDADDGEKRETWGKKLDFLLSVIGFAVDLANVWRFPYLCYRNGGGAFLIPYIIMLAIGGIPLFFMELVLGQYHRKGSITCWGRLVPLFKGVGYAVVLIAFLVDFYYNVIIAWALRFFFASFTSRLPWVSCNNPWNTDACREIDSEDRKSTLLLRNRSSSSSSSSWNRSSSFIGDGYNASSAVAAELGSLLSPTGDELSQGNVTAHREYTSPAQEYFMREILDMDKSRGIDDLGAIQWDMALCLLAVYLICYFSLWKGISTSGKVVWFTALFPYAVLTILLIHGITLPGAEIGIAYYLKPDFSRIADSKVWVDAATQVFFSLGPGFGVLMAFASYNEFHNNVYHDALLTSCVNSLTSFVSGFVIFSVLGYMSEKLGKDISEVATEGPGLVFVVYPEAIATMPGSTFFAIIFFMMLLTLGLDSSFGGSEAIITALSDEFPVIKRNREVFVACLFSLYFLVGLCSVSEGGFYVFQLLEAYAATYSMLFAVFFEAIAVSWIYGIDRFSDDIEEMLGFRPGIYWRFCWKFAAPAFLLFIIVYGLKDIGPLQIGDYKYPAWANYVGWAMAASSVAMIPLVAVIQLILAKGTLRERWRSVLRPWRDQQQMRHVEGSVDGGRQLNNGLIPMPSQRNSRVEMIDIAKYRTRNRTTSPASTAAGDPDELEPVDV